MTEREALKLAQKALSNRNAPAKTIYEALHAIKEALMSVPDGAQPEQEPVAWKLVPVEPTKEMLKAMDECSTEGYDERLYAGHAASVYMAAVDVAPTPPPVAEPHKRKPLMDEEIHRLDPLPHEMFDQQRIDFARAIEAAHGIKENK